MKAFWIDAALALPALAVALATAAAGLLAAKLHGVPAGLTEDDLLLGRWLAAWGDAWLAGLLASTFVAYRPHRLATYADRLYLPQSGPDQPMLRP